MAGKDSTDVTLAHVDPSLVSCWDKMVKRGEECSLLLKHSKESHCYAAMHNASQNYDLIKFFDSLSRGEEEEQQEEGGQEEEIGEAPGLPPTPGGRKGTSAKQADGGASCSLRFSLNQNHK